MSDFSLSSTTGFDPSRFDLADASAGGHSQMPDIEPATGGDPHSASLDDATAPEAPFHFDLPFTSTNHALSGSQFDTGGSRSDIVAQGTDPVESGTEEPDIRFGTALVNGLGSTPVGNAFVLTPHGENGLNVEDSKFFLGAGGLVGTYQPSTGDSAFGVGTGFPVPGGGTVFGNARVEIANPFDNPFDGIAKPGAEPLELFGGRLKLDNPFDGNGKPWEAPDLSLNGGYFAPVSPGGTSLGGAGSVTVDSEDGFDEGLGSPYVNPLGQL